MTAAYAGVEVLVTGADGFIGSHLVERLAARGAETGLDDGLSLTIDWWRARLAAGKVRPGHDTIT